MNLRPRRCGSTSATRVTAGRTAWAPGITHRVRIARATPAGREPYYYLNSPRRAGLQLQLCRHTHQAHSARATTPAGREPYYYLNSPHRADLQLHTHLTHKTHAGTPATTNAAPTADILYDGLPATLPPLPRRHTAAKLLPTCRFFGYRYRWRVPVTRPMLYLIPTAAAGERL